jgi:hypothetical protein
VAYQRGHKFLPEALPHEAQQEALQEGAREETIALLQLILCANDVQFEEQ